MQPLSIIFIVGPTAVGKTGTAFDLAGKLGGEIISCDAMQVYREVSIVSEKPPAFMRERIAHHLVDVVSVREEFDVSLFSRLAVEAIRDIHSRGLTPIVTGGSGMYMQVLLDGIFEGDHKDPDLRSRLEQRAMTEGGGVLYEELRAADPEAAGRIHPHDQRRVIRALEVFLLTGRPISHMQKIREGLWGQAPVRLFALDRPRPELYERINARVDRMLDAGLVEEIRRLKGMDLSQTARGMLGVPEISAYLDGECDLPGAVAQLKMNTRRFAKRQLTWFRREARCEWIDLGPGDGPGETAEIIWKKLS